MRTRVSQWVSQGFVLMMSMWLITPALLLGRGRPGDDGSWFETIIEHLASFTRTISDVLEVPGG